MLIAYVCSQSADSASHCMQNFPCSNIPFFLTVWINKKRKCRLTSRKEQAHLFLVQADNRSYCELAGQSRYYSIGCSVNLNTSERIKVAILTSTIANVCQCSFFFPIPCELFFVIFSFTALG